ncbi:MAG: carboxylating nicotinate-nucleotide diphosphorylase [Terriglobales bacterium]
MDWNTPSITHLLERALEEDHALADATTRLTVPAELTAQAEVYAQQPCVLAGLGLAARVFAVYAALARQAGTPARPPVVATHRAEIFDGVRLQPGDTALVLRGPAHTLLACERLVLNLLQRLSGIATLTRQYVDAVAGLRAVILDTRKTAPGLRALDKYAVTCGGGRNHRTDLSAAILVKNNHIKLAGGVECALERARAGRRPGQKIEIEVRTPAEIAAALAGGAERVLLDNMKPEQVREALALIAGRVPVEVSGGVRLATVRAYAETGCDFISVGAITHSAPAAELAMRIIPVGDGAVGGGTRGGASVSAEHALGSAPLHGQDA